MKALEVLLLVLSSTRCCWGKGLNCTSVMANAGLNMSILVTAVGHGIHSATVKDLRYYFDEYLPETNDIPTVNPNFSQPHLLTYAPMGSSDFSTPGMRAFDTLFADDDGTDKYMIHGLSRVEKLTHSLHMLELWLRAGIKYRDIAANGPPGTDVCACVTEESKDDIKQEMTYISQYLRAFGNQTEERRVGVGSAGCRYLYRYSYRYSYSYRPACTACTGKHCTGGNQIKQENRNENGKSLPDLVDQTSWTAWKDMLKQSMLDDNHVKHLATYLYCKIKALKDASA